MRVVVAGEIPLVLDIGRLCIDAGHATHIYIAEEFHDALDSGLVTKELTDAGVAIELQNESVEAKQAQLRGLAQVLPGDTLILSSTMATSATEAASWLPNSQRLVGFGLLPPLSTPGLVEVAAALQTAARSMNEAKAFWQTLDLRPVVVGDGPGLVRARAVCCLINEAASALLEGVASAEDIDVAMRLGTNYPFGPLEWADIIGIDGVLSVMSGLFREWGEDRYRPSPLLRRMVQAGRLGQKSGQGFYSYTVDGERIAQ